jgi:hypothetical protein
MEREGPLHASNGQKEASYRRQAVVSWRGRPVSVGIQRQLNGIAKLGEMHRVEGELRLPEDHGDDQKSKRG